MTGDADQAVHDQYAAYPYPARDPKDEAKRLIVGSPSHLKEVNHHLFAGARDFAIAMGLFYIGRRRRRWC